MKKGFLVLAVVGLGIMSCNEKKDYKCTCDMMGIKSSTIINATKDDATKQCNQTTTVAGLSMKCAIE